jgi:hypothetical protein
MKRIVVGDVVVDGASVQVNGRSLLGANEDVLLSAPPLTLSQRLLLQPPLGRSLLAALGGAAAVVGVLPFLWRGPFLLAALLPIGIGTLAVAALQPWLARRLRVDLHVALGHAVAPVVARLTPVLRSTMQRHTVESLSARLQLPAAATGLALAWMREEGALDEELDTTSGHFYYALAPDAMRAHESVRLPYSNER